MRVETNFTKPIIQAYKKFGVLHVLIRGIEFSLLQTRFTTVFYWLIAPQIYQWWYSRPLQQYDQSLRAFERRYINPKRVDQLTPRGKPGSGVLKDIGSVIDGSWDQKQCQSDRYSLLYAETIDDTLLYKAIKSRHETGVEWQETKFYRTVIRLIENDTTKWHGCSTLDEVDQRCKHVDYLYKDIKNNGYKTQDEIPDTSPSLDEPFGFMNQYLMEITVDITRDGNVLLVDGRHRLIIAQLLDLDRIPVTVIVRHKKWMKKLRQTTSMSEQELLEKTA